MASKNKAYINPEILKWAREEMNYDIDEAARKIGINSQKLIQWEAGQKMPTLRQLRLIAKLYKRPSAFFYLKDAPDATKPDLPDYRQLPDENLERTPQMSLQIRRAFERRETYIELLHYLGKSCPEFKFEIDSKISTTELALKIREQLGISIDDQFSWKDHYTALNSWIDLLEKQNILIFQTGELDLAEMRGLSISEQFLPIILINSKDSPRGRIFTLMHELVHIVIGQSGICDLDDNDSNDFEVFCNKVAGEILVPKQVLKNDLDSITDYRDPFQLEYLANRYMVSVEVILRRLLILNKITKNFYQKKREEYLETYKKSKSQGFLLPAKKVVRDNGKLYTDLIISAYRDDIISLRDVSNYLGNFKINHLPKVESQLYK
ncbi:ImmA/IrrE family metallo-endopeptidase [Natranaerobius thermophilus]|uniref:HTH cro/C1-type domain-containing protein n=1 Tax=Natranaerobius thermophilus (strain ATCC BAA-1301 / DSM 18059 / JW/NM-WN-LF) TaxID=457570 RepID=B2A1E1_NATTJ|nr:XRE family transcriptional regulator [Natranaerobius thermophilus]ACB86079.1 protein of unknown function DUF955 [Natranaerobius thermophilus JW/NM-WN-LF]